MPREWGKREFKRRWNLPGEYDQDFDPDCRKPRVSMFGEKKRTRYTDEGMSRQVQHASKQIKAPNADVITGLLEDLDSERQNAETLGCGSAFDEGGKGFASLLGGSAATQEAVWWEAAIEGKSDKNAEPSSPRAARGSSETPLSDKKFRSEKEEELEEFTADEGAEVSAKDVVDDAIFLALVSQTRDELKDSMNKALADAEKEEKVGRDLMTRHKARGNTEARQDIATPLEARVSAIQHVFKPVDEFNAYKNTLLREDGNGQDNVAALPCPRKFLDVLLCKDDLARAVCTIGVDTTCMVTLQKETAKLKADRIGAIKFITVSLGRLNKHFTDLLAKDDKEMLSRAAAQRAQAAGKGNVIATVGKSSALAGGADSRIFQLDLTSEKIGTSHSSIRVTTTSSELPKLTRHGMYKGQLLPGLCFRKGI